MFVWCSTIVQSVRYTWWSRRRRKTSKNKAYWRIGV